MSLPVNEVIHNKRQHIAAYQVPAAPVSCNAYVRAASDSWPSFAAEVWLRIKTVEAIAAEFERV